MVSAGEAGASRGCAAEGNAGDRVETKPQETMLQKNQVETNPMQRKENEGEPKMARLTKANASLRRQTLTICQSVLFALRQTCRSSFPVWTENRRADEPLSRRGVTSA
jgi:hypothetical protein